MNLYVNEQTSSYNIGLNLPILVIDDDQAMRDMLETVLLDEGYSVILARNGKEGLELAARQRPAPVLLLSASRQLVSTARQNPVKAYIPKPFELVKLLDYIDRYKENYP